MSLQRAENLVQLFNNGDYDDDIEPFSVKAEIPQLFTKPKPKFGLVI
jgi:hypothetical protein